MGVLDQDRLYLDYHFPVPLINFIEGLLDGGEDDRTDPNQPFRRVDSSKREWLSQPRPCTDNTIEVIQVNFKLPLSVSELSFQALRVPCHIEAWYQDRQNNWRQMLDGNRFPVALDLSASDQISWYKFHTNIYPLVAKSVQIRINRTPTELLGNQPFTVGLKETLIRRNVYDRSDGTQAFEDEQDAVGNVIAKYIKDWDAPKAIDDDATTFWRSEALPSPDAVASMYLDVRDTDGSPQLIDRLYLDPVYTNQWLNLYYSNDDTVGTRKLSPISLPPSTDLNTQWQAGKGLWDTSTDPHEASYQMPVTWGPLINQDIWFGLEWSPDFDPTSGPAHNPVLLGVTPPTPVTGQFVPTVFYDVGGAEFKLELFDGTTSHVYTAACSPLFHRNDTLRIVVGWSYDPRQVFISVKLPNGTELASYSADPGGSFPTNISLDGTVGFDYFRGLYTATVIKQESYLLSSSTFQQTPVIYVNPEPVQPDASGVVPATTLDDAILACDWTAQNYATGGSHQTHFEDKEWTPIWRDYMSQKGLMYFPQSISMKYMKLEFSNLTEEPYPVYDQGVQVSYKVFPVTVVLQNPNNKSSSREGIFGGLLGWSPNVIVNGVPSVNWLNQSTVRGAANAVYGKQQPLVAVSTGPPFVTTAIPQTQNTIYIDQQRPEMSMPQLYRRDALNTDDLVNGAYEGMFGSEDIQGLNLFSGGGLDFTTLFQNTRSTTPTNISPGALPIRGSDWWIVPGQTMKIPASTMTQLTWSQVDTEIKQSPGARLRFVTTSVHKYDIKTVTRDASVAYFAGIREVQPYVTTYIANEDKPEFDFSIYNPTEWVFTNIQQLDSGPISSNSNPYEFDNSDLLVDLSNWDTESGAWTYDGFVGHSAGSASLTADGTDHYFTDLETIPVSPGDHITVSGWFNYANITSTSGAKLALQIVTYNGGSVVTPHQALGGSTAVIDNPTGTVDGYNLIHVWGDYTVPGSGVDGIRVQFFVDHRVTAGTVWADDAHVHPFDGVTGTIFKDFVTQSDFAKVQVDFRDSGLIRSDQMWADIDPLNTNIPATQLAPATQTIPPDHEHGFWSDTFADWGDLTVDWGEPHAVVSINIDQNRVYQGKRAIHFTRDAGAGEAGIKVQQETNYVPNALFRIGCVFYKPNANTNTITLNLRRISDGVYIYTETIQNPAVGYWYNYQTKFIEVPDTEDQLYTVELVLEGDDADELYLNDLYTEVAMIRYFMRLGDGSSFLHDVTDLRYANSAIVSTTTPVNEFSVQAMILSDRAWLYGSTATPLYLQ